MYKNMLKFKILVKTVFIPQSKFTCLGTPEQLTSFCIKNSSFLKKTFSLIFILYEFDNKYNVDRYLENIKF